MKSIIISCNVSTVQLITDILDALKTGEYLITESVSAHLPTGSHRMNNSVWPGYNSLIYILATEDEKAVEILEQLRRYNAGAFNKDELISVSCWKIDDYFNS